MPETYSLEVITEEGGSTYDNDNEREDNSGEDGRCLFTSFMLLVRFLMLIH